MLGPRSAALALVFSLLPFLASAHRPDTSYLKLSITGTTLETRFSCDILTLLRLVPGLDADGDHTLTLREAQAAAPRIAAYLRQHLHLDLDGREEDWGQALAPVWPGEPENPIGMADWHQRLLHFPFQRGLQRLPREVAVTCDVFIELGTSHRIQGEYFLDGRARLPVVFSLEEPDYVLHIPAALAQSPLPAGAAASPAPPLRPFWLGLEQILSRPGSLACLLLLSLGASPRRLPLTVSAYASGHLLAASASAFVPGLVPLQGWPHASAALGLLTAGAAVFLLPATASGRVLLPVAVLCGLILGPSPSPALSSPVLSPAALPPFLLGLGAGLVPVLLALLPWLAPLDSWRQARASR